MKTTSITITENLAQRIDALNEKNEIKYRKDFVEFAVCYFENTGFDIKGEIYGVTTEQQVNTQLEEMGRNFAVMQEQQKAVNFILEKIVKGVDVQSMLLPPNEQVRAEAAARAETEIKYNRALSELTRVKKELAQIKRVINGLHANINTEF